MYVDRAMYNMKKAVQNFFRELLELMFNAAALVIDTLRTFFWSYFRYWDPSRSPYPAGTAFKPLSASGSSATSVFTCGFRSVTFSAACWPRYRC